MVKPGKRREAVAYLVQCHGQSERRACGVLRQSRATQRYTSKARDQSPLRIRLRDLALARPRYGYRRLHVLLRREGWPVNVKRVWRHYKLLELSLRRKVGRKKRASQLRVEPPAPTRCGQQWCMDFVTDELVSGQRFRALTVVDIFSRSSELLEPAVSLTGKRVVEALDQVAQVRGYPEAIRVDNGGEFCSKEMDAWAYRNGVKLLFSRPGKPTDNGYIESFNGKLRDECLNQHLFTTIKDAKEKLEAWRKDYNQNRPHSALGNLTPAEYERLHTNEKPRKSRS